MQSIVSAGHYHCQTWVRQPLHGDSKRWQSLFPPVLYASDTSWGAGAQPVPWTQGHSYGIHMSSVRSVHFLPAGASQQGTPARACRFPQCCMVQAELSTGAEFGCWEQMLRSISQPCCVSDLLALCLTPCDFAPSRFKGTGVLQWHLWLPVPHLPLHGEPAGTAPGGGLEGLAGDDGSGWEGGATLPGPRLNGNGSDWMAPKSNGKVLPYFTCVLARLSQAAKPELFFMQVFKVLG